MPAFTYERTIRLADTDAAGVVFFARTLALCHEAYEAALAAAGCPVQDFLGTQSDTLIPISRVSADYLRPLFCGDRVRITLRPTRLSENSFAIDYDLVRLGDAMPPANVSGATAAPQPQQAARAKVAARARSEHVCTSRSERSRTPLPEPLAAWVDAA